MAFIIIAPGFSTMALTGLSWEFFGEEEDWDTADWFFGVESKGVDPLRFDTESQARAWLESMWAARPAKVVSGAYPPGSFKVVWRD